MTAVRGKQQWERVFIKASGPQDSHHLYIPFQTRKHDGILLMEKMSGEAEAAVGQSGGGDTGDETCSGSRTPNQTGNHQANLIRVTCTPDVQPSAPQYSFNCGTTF
jgi:hypothetical protein